MKGVNKVILVGNLGNDPQISYFPNGAALARFQIATTEMWTDKQSGQPREEVEWHRIVLHGRLAEIAGEFLRKGSKVYIEGRNKTRKWTDQGGIVRFTTEVVGREMQILIYPNQQDPMQQQPTPRQQPSYEKTQQTTPQTPGQRARQQQQAANSGPATQPEPPIDDDVPPF